MVPQVEREGSSTPVEEGPRIVFLGTSLTEGYGLPSPEASYPARIGAMADSAGYRIQAVNSGVAGETSAGALARIEWVLSQDVDVLVLEMGANDGLRGIPPATLRENLEQLVDQTARTRPETPILLLAMEAPPNLGTEYAQQFRQVYADLAEHPQVHPGPFLLEGVAGVRELNQADGIHPTEAGHRRMARTVWPYLEPLLEAWHPEAQNEGGPSPPPPSTSGARTP